MAKPETAEIKPEIAEIKPETTDAGAAYEYRLDLALPSHGNRTRLEAGEGGIDNAAAQRARRKFDYAILPLFTLLYGLNLMGNLIVGNAAEAGLAKDLKMNSNQLSFAIGIFYVPHIGVMLFSNFLIRKIGPRKFFASSVFLWSTVVTLQGLVTTYQQLIVCRVFLGLFEGPFISGSILYLSEFYKRHCLQKRISILLCSWCLGGAFAGVLTSTILRLHGKGGKPGWSWLFILAGIFTWLHGFVVYFKIPEDISDAKFLKEDEKTAVLAELCEEMTVHTIEEGFRVSSVWSALKSPHILILASSCFFIGNLLLGIGYFTPTIVAGLGYSQSKTQLLTSIPFAVGFVVSILAAYLSDRFRSRGLIAIGFSLITLGGFIMMYLSKNAHVRWGSLFIQAAGVPICMQCLCTWVSNNVTPHYRRATALALVSIMTSAGGLLATWLYKDAPKFHTTTEVSIGCIVAYIFNCCLGLAYLHYQNVRKAEKRALQRVVPVNDHEEKLVLGDKHHDFVYTL